MCALSSRIAKGSHALPVVQPPAGTVACAVPRLAGGPVRIAPTDGPEYLAMTAMMDFHPKSSACREQGTDRQQYGALPWRRTKHGEIEVLLITSRERKRWILPKGWPIKGKTPSQAAAQEAFEEAGVMGDTHPRPIGSYDYKKLLRDGTHVNCSVALFGLCVRGTLVNWPERGERKRRWHHLAEAANRVSDAELAIVLNTLQGDLGVFRLKTVMSG